MGDINDILANLGDLGEKFKPTLPIEVDTSAFVKNFVPQFPTVKIDEESTFAYKMQQQTNQIIEKSNEQIKLLNQQNEQLLNNQKKLEDLYALKDQELKEAKQAAEEAKKEAKKSKRYNAAMLILTIISMLVAIAAWLRPNVLSV